jgi:DASH complex subunit DAD3
MEPSESRSTSALASYSAEELSPLEQDVLDEYERLAENMKKVWQPFDSPQFPNSILSTWMLGGWC